MINYGVVYVPTLIDSVGNYLHIIHSSTSGDGVFLDGASLDSESWVTSYADDYAYLEISIDEGHHELYSDTPFSAMVSGLDIVTDRGFMFNVDSGIICIYNYRI